MSTATPPRRRVKKRILVPVILLVSMLAFMLWVYVRGSWTDSAERNPATSTEGPISQLYRTPQGDVQLRCAIRIDRPPSKVWAVIRDYPNHPNFLPYVSAMEVRPGENDRVCLVGVAHSRLWGDWPFTVHVDHKAISDQEYVASWDQPSEEITVNRGSWRLTGTGPNQTLVVYTIQVEVGRYPSFLIRNLLIDRLPGVLRAMRDETNRRQAQP